MFHAGAAESWAMSAIGIIELEFYPSLIGPSVKVNYLGTGPDRFLLLMQFTVKTYIFGIKIMSAFNPLD